MFDSTCDKTVKDVSVMVKRVDSLGKVKKCFDSNEINLDDTFN